MRTVVTPGEGHVARWSDAVAVVGPPGPAADEVVIALDAMARRDVESVRALLDAAEGVSAAVVIFDGGEATVGGHHHAVVAGTAVVAHGAATLTAAGPTAAFGTVTGTPLALGLDGSVDASAGGIHDLREGIVAGVGATVIESATADDRGDTGDVHDDVSGDSDSVGFGAATGPTGEFSFVDLRATVTGVPAREPLPVEAAPDPQSAMATTVVAPALEEPGVEVLGIHCARGHFNHPHARYCHRCGLSMVHLTHNLVPGVRPTLGFLVFDDGATWALDRSYVVGRERGGAGAGADRLVVGGDASTVSVDHAEIRLEDWDVTLVDLGSTNGTFLWDATAQSWERLAPRRPVVIPPGSAAAVGHRTFVYESALLR